MPAAEMTTAAQHGQPEKTGQVLIRVAATTVKMRNATMLQGVMPAKTATLTLQAAKTWEAEAARMKAIPVGAMKMTEAALHLTVTFN
jgi:hypothetical protein